MRTYLRLVLGLALVLFFAVSTNTLHAQNAAPAILPGGILSAAALTADPGNVAAPGALVTILGQNLAGTTASAGSPLPRELNGTAVQVGNVFAPLLFISPTQINIQIPLETPADTTVAVTVWVSGRPSAPVSLRVQATAPGIFTTSANGVGAAVAFHANSAQVTSASPATPGEEVQILVTGLGVTLAGAGIPSLASGEAGNGQPTLFVPTANLGGSAAPVAASIAAPGLVGQYLVKVIIPNVAPGDQALSITSSGRTTVAPVFLPIGVPGQAVDGGVPGGGAGAGGPVIFVGGIVNAASLAPSPNNPASPGGLISIFGNNLATTTEAAGGAPLPFNLSGTSVLINNLAAPLLLVSPSQINAQVPFEIQSGTTVDVVVVVNGRASAPEPLRVAAAAPGIFTVSGSGAGPARALHPNGSPVTSAAPALPGEELTIVTTGLGLTLSVAGLPAVRTGEAAAGQLTVLTPTATINDKAARVTFSATAPGLVGEYLVKLIVPDVPAGDQSLTLAAAGNTSRTVTLRVGFLFGQPPAFFQASLAGSFTTSFGLKVKVPDPVDPDQEIEEIASFSKTVNAPGCTIEIAGTDGPTYTALVHCQDYSNPNDLIAIIMGLKDGQFANNKLVFTTQLDTGVNHFFYIGTGASPTRTFTLIAEAPIDAGALSIDFQKPNFGPGDPPVVIGTIHLSIKLGGTGTIPNQTVVVGGGFTDTITFVRR